ncbi:MAG: alpha-L-fucosidase [Acidimicrobiales bacterium]
MPLRDPHLRRLRHRRIPAWWPDAKLGIFVHWTPASVPAFAPTGVDISDLVQSGTPNALASTPYAEWYQNSLRFPDSPAAIHHEEVYGSRPYDEFASDWEAALKQWDPDDWARRFAATGARYVVFVTKHMDGYCLWPSEVTNRNHPGWFCKRDVVGEMSEAVRAAGMRFGVYYSGGLDATFNDFPIGSVADLMAAVPRGDYPAYADAQVRELIARYRPSVLWNDIAWPSEAKRLWPLIAHYYEQVPDGVVNDRWMAWNAFLASARTSGGRRLIDAGAQRLARRDGGIVPPAPAHYDYRTPEYVTFPEVQRQPWECVRGIDQSFGYNAQSQPEQFLPRDELLWMLTDIVAKGGNLLLNVGPRGIDAQIPDDQQLRLDWLGEWTRTHHDAFSATRPWVTAGTATAEGHPLRYTARDDVVFAILQDASGTVTLREVRSTPTTLVTTVDGQPVSWRDDGAGLAVDLPPSVTATSPTAIALRRVEARSTI